MYKIVLVSSGQPSLNPRLVKEADSLADAGYQVTVIYQYWNHWGTQLDKKLLPGKKWKAIRVGGSPDENKRVYWYSRLRHKLGQKITGVFGVKSPFAEMAIGRCTNLLIQEASKHNADLYIAHNLAALPAAVKAAKKNKSKCGFDAEDFHRYEVSDNNAELDVRLKTYIEDKYLPHVNYLTTSSPLISDAYQKLYALSPLTLLNTFPMEKPVEAVSTREDEKLKLFWFSQTVSSDRGVADCIKALQLIDKPDIELHLLGYASDSIKQQLSDAAGSKVALFFHEPIPSDEIIAFASQFDIGLAMEAGVPFNRDICLTNKIFTCVQAGLAIIASDTSAQSQLLNKYPGIGSIYQKGNIQSLADAISYYNQNRAQLLSSRAKSSAIAKEELNWEHESQKFLSLIKNIITG
jgi:glycosyltransferase involved in cell wall biosynthesis